MFIILVVVALIVALILNSTTLGRHIYAVGGNIEAARVSGINVDRVRLFCYSSSGVMGGLSVWGPTPSSGYWPCDCF